MDTCGYFLIPDYIKTVMWELVYRNKLFIHCVSYYTTKTLSKTETQQQRTCYEKSYYPIVIIVVSIRLFVNLTH